MKVTRRELLKRALLAGGAAALGTRPGVAQSTAVITRPISQTGEALPVVGLGSWITFNVGDDPKLLEECAAVMAAFFEAGGRMIDSCRCTDRHNAIGVAVSRQRCEVHGRGRVRP